MKKIVLMSLVLMLFIVSSAAAGTVTIINPVVTKKQVKKIPEVLKTRLSLVGSFTVKQATQLLTRASGIPFVLKNMNFRNNSNMPAVSGKKGGKPQISAMSNSNTVSNGQDYYFIHKPLYMILNAVIVANGYSYQYKHREIIVNGLVSAVFHLPLTDLNHSFSAMTGNGASGGAGAMGGQTGMTGSASTGQIGMTGSAGSTGMVGQTGMTGSAGMSGSTGSSGMGGSISEGMYSENADLTYINSMLKPMISKSGFYKINPVLGIVYVRDLPANVKRVGKLIKKIRNNMVEAVVLKVKVLSVTLNNKFQAGINWNEVFNHAFSSNVLGLSNITIGANLASGAGITSGSPSVEFAGAGGASKTVLTALSTQGTVNVLSTPDLMVLNGQTRSIGSNTISSYVQTVESITNGLSSSSSYPVMAQVTAGLTIAFTPHINKKTGVITVTVNFLDNDITGYNNFSIADNTFRNPNINSESLIGTVRVKNNFTAIMGGIDINNNSKQNYGVPLLSSIPIIGDLFKGLTYSPCLKAGDSGINGSCGTYPSNAAYSKRRRPFS